MAEPRRFSGATYREADEEYFERHRLRRHAGVWSLWALGVAAVISGDFFGWNFGLAYGFGGLLVATVVITVMYFGLCFSIAEMSPALPHTGGAYSFARSAMGPWRGFATGAAAAGAVQARTRPGLQLSRPLSMTVLVETPSFTFRLERVRTLRERAEERAQEALAHELRLRVRGEALLREATLAVGQAREAGLNAVGAGRASAHDLLAVQAYLERTERTRREAALDLDRQDAEVDARRAELAAAARDRQAIDKLKDRRRADHEREWARRAQNQLDELALGVHRRGSVAA